MNLLLYRLHLRRALNPVLGVLLLGVGLFVIGSRRVGAQFLDTEESSIQLLRADVVFALLAVLVPLLLAGVAGTFRRLDESERHWLLPRRISRSSIAISTWTGVLSGALLWLVAIGLSCELTGEGGEPSLREAQSLEMQQVGRVGTEGDLVWLTPGFERPAGSVARLGLGLFGNYGEVEAVELIVRESQDADAFDVGTAQPGMHTLIEVELPAGHDALHFEFRARGVSKALMLHDTKLRLFVPASERAAVLSFLLRIALTLTGLLALVLGLGAWLSPASLLLALIGGYSLLWLEAEALAGSFLERWLPGYDLPAAFGLLSQGRASQALPVETWLGAGVLVLVGLSLHRLAMGRWRLGA
jgi:hypothetical protein